MSKTKNLNKDFHNIWLVEDNAHFRRTMKWLINRTTGMQCTQAFESCEEALVKLASDVPPEIILLDINLPGMSGIQGIEKIKSISPTTHIIILTVYDDNEKVFDALCAGASGYLLKDSSPEKIINSIEEAIAGGAPMSMPIAHKVLEIFSQLKPKKADYGLTTREKELLQLVTSGLTRQQIADKLFISFHTVTTHMKNIYSKLHVNSKSGAVSKVYKENIL
ncbi:MAG: LuxR family transcriptional regulator [Ignavibacteria bacterium RIFOXYB2_FULL_35_12]|nr:MAG: LuxR family transcriptional regulator [Ignavibacteria bacterium GWC2_35_8]OGU59977.1 MAG: LuxR family transcriptional regulator [Ignavibacteria bacterium GWF2_35_20]OGU80287.1 MAG: LuxR family transcriptional regulator [Ignavibacteria bacterium RBG_16_35_7]OGU83656.1 MAG: LuxR family transcriptional regulator [Ignavibacteria bacterium RIFOXYA2_FULL_35_9]OGU89083.1 MAG: LuxR family transcriptional regulator [Ignavibacteria bacterium RIFOXYC12_FULL_35_11]OGU91222.1 MAG: LuxR family trans